MTYSEQPTLGPPEGDRAPLVSPDSPNTQAVSPPRAIAEPDQGKPYLQIENVHKTFGSFVALRDIYLDVYPGEFLCLLGPSGCGKTTLLRIIAGLEQQTSGRIIQAGKDVSNLPPALRDFGIVFQSYALFPNLTATQNIAYGLENARQPKERITTRVNELLNTVGLESMGHKYPSQLSGGQQQRVALARALALSPGLLLLDEPLSALDAQVRVKLRTEIADLQRRLGITTIMVTHDQSEALAMADRIVVMDKGYIAQVGSPRSVYQRPTTPFVANFIGVMNFMSGQVESAMQVRCGNIHFAVPPTDFTVGSPVAIAIRPEDMQVLHNSEGEGLPNVLQGEVQSIEFLGSAYRVALRPQGDAKELVTLELSSQEAGRLDLGPGSLFTLHFPPDRIQLFAA